MDNQLSQDIEVEVTPTDETKKKGISRKLIYAFLIFDLVVFVPIVLFFVIVPTGDIKTLKEGHVEVEVIKKAGSPKGYEVNYKIVSKKPKNWVSLKEMDYTAIHAIVISEDWAFYDHSGYDVNQIKEAAEEAIDGDRTRGASTISQQLVKNIFLTPDKQVSRKVKELGISVYMERNVSKEKILETYLNVIEFGPGIYGIKAAAKHYFGKSPKELNAREGAFLAMLLPNPKKNSQSFRDKKLTPFAKKRINSVLEKMSVAKYIRDDQVKGLKRKAFKWERPGSSTFDDRDDTQTNRDQIGAKKSGAGLNSGTLSKRRKRDLTGKAAEAKLKKDDSLRLEENPEFDEDAIIEDMSGFESEFSVE